MNPLEEIKGLTIGQLAALVHGIGGEETVKAFLRGELKLKINAEESTIEIVEVERKLFDKNGRRIPPSGLKGAVCDPDKNVNICQSLTTFAEVLARLEQYFPNYLGKFFNVKDFANKTTVLLGQLRGDEDLANLLKGTWLPICFPQAVIEDYLESIKNIFLPAVENVYKNKSPGKEFFNTFKKYNCWGITKDIRSLHWMLLEKMKQGPVVGIMFFPLQGYSVTAQIEQMSSLPSSLLLVV
jgi:hypothetical protein